MPDGARFVQESIFGNTLEPQGYDAVLLLSVLEHLGLPTYGQSAVPDGDRRALAECGRLLKADGVLLATVPAGRPRITSWYRQYTPERIETLFEGWSLTVEYFAYADNTYAPVISDEVPRFDYRDRCDGTGGAAVVALIEARPASPSGW